MSAPNPVAFTLFGLDVRWYGILIGLGFILAILISYKRAPMHGIKQDYILDFHIGVIPAGIIGARAYYVIFDWQNYAGDIGKIFNIRLGGLAIHGGIIAGIIVGIIISKYHKIKFSDLADTVFPTVALAQAIGRWGNFFNSEAHGGPTDLPWGIMVNGVKVHPTFLYESIWCLVMFIFLIWLDNRRSFSGQIGLLYVMLYSVERFFVEALRTDSLMIGPFKQAQVISASSFILALAAYIILMRRNNKRR